MTVEKFQDQYIGDITGGLVREAAMHKAKCAYFEAMVHSKDQKIAELTAQLEAAGVKPKPDHYINQEHTAERA